MTDLLPEYEHASALLSSLEKEAKELAGLKDAADHKR